MHTERAWAEGGLGKKLMMLENDGQGTVSGRVSRA